MAKPQSSSTAKGNAFRSHVASLLAAAGFEATEERRINHKKVDILGKRHDIEGTTTYAIEAKDYGSTCTKTTVRDFVQDYESLIQTGAADRAWLISNNEISPDARALVNEKVGCTAFTFSELQRNILGLDTFLNKQIRQYEEQRIGEWYIPLHTQDDKDLGNEVRSWIFEPESFQLAIVADYGKGKSTFAQHLTYKLAQEALSDYSYRVPIYIALGDIVTEQGLEGLLGKILASTSTVRNYNFELFRELNKSGRFVVVLDGFDEMKHGMTLPQFERNINELMRLDEGDAKIIILGRHTAFQDHHEFRSIIHGRQTTSGKQEVRAQGRRPFQELYVREFHLTEARRFVSSYFPIAAERTLRSGEVHDLSKWITQRKNELLSGELDTLLTRPVHAQMLCEVAVDPTLNLRNLSKQGLFDRFVHVLIDREVRKIGRHPNFTLNVRRQFNAALALWLWIEGRASTVSLASVPMDLCHEAARDIDHDLDDDGLKRELTKGCLIEKADTTVFFGHRSLQEFLVAERLLQTDLMQQIKLEDSDVITVLKHLNPEIKDFLVEALVDRGENERVKEWVGFLQGIRRTDMPPVGLSLFAEACSRLDERVDGIEEDPWYVWVEYFRRVGYFDPSYSSEYIDAYFFEPIGSAFRSHKKEIIGSALILSSMILRSTGGANTPLNRQIVGNWLNVRSFVNAAQRARQIGRNEYHYIKLEDDPTFWVFLQAATFERSDHGIEINIYVDKVLQAARNLAHLGIGDDNSSNRVDTLDYVTISSNELYKALGVKEARLDKARPFFNDDHLRSKIRPLEVTTKNERHRRIQNTQRVRKERNTLKLN